MCKRKRKRATMVLAVHAAGEASDGTHFERLTHTLDVAPGGVRLGGMQQVPLGPGNLIEIRRKFRRAMFRVVWVGKPGTPNCGQVGLEATDAPPDFWGLEIPGENESPVAVREQIIASNADIR